MNLIHRLPDSDNSRLMKYDLDTRQNTFKRVRIIDASPKELSVGIEIARRFVGITVNLWFKAIEYADPMASLKKSVDEMGADETCPTGDENSTHDQQFSSLGDLSFV
jgi:hypothetical protein